MSWVKHRKACAPPDTAITLTGLSTNFSSAEGLSDFVHNWVPLFQPLSGTINFTLELFFFSLDFIIAE